MQKLFRFFFLILKKLGNFSITHLVEAYLLNQEIKGFESSPNSLVERGNKIQRKITLELNLGASIKLKFV